MSLPRSSYYRADRPQDTKARTEFRAAVEAVCLDWPAYGYRRVTHELRRRGWHVNHKRVSRMMREEALTVRQVKRFLATPQLFALLFLVGGLGYVTDSAFAAAIRFCSRWK